MQKNLTMRPGSESEYNVIAEAIGTDPQSKHLIMSNDVKVGLRTEHNIFVSPEALKVAQDRAIAKRENNKTVIHYVFNKQKRTSNESKESSISQKAKEVLSNNRVKQKNTGKSLKRNYVLIDFENVQPKNLEVLKGNNFKVIVFIGEKQTKIPFELAQAMQSLGADADYVKINGNGPNALDFHIAFYIGHIAAKDNDCYFHITSKDTGFDPLIRHLKSRKIHAQREKTIGEIPLLKIANSKSKPERVDAIVEFLKARGNAKPRTLKTLSNSINSLFARTLEEVELSGLVEELINRKVVVQNGTKVTYKL